jgi:hypothetical protein
MPPSSQKSVLREVKRLIRRQEKGILLRFELPFRLVELAAWLAPEDVASLVQLLPPDLCKDLRNELNRLPSSDEEWERFELMTGSVGNEVLAKTRDEYIRLRKERHEQHKQFARKGVDSLRVYFASLD